MRNLLHTMTLAATAVAMSAGTIALTTSAAHAGAPPVPEALRELARTTCAAPYWDSEGYHAGEPTNLYLEYSSEPKDESGDVTARWAVIEGYDAHLQQSILCGVAQVDEPSAIAGRRDSSAALVVTGADDTNPFRLTVNNPAYSASPADPAFSYDEKATSHPLGTAAFRDADADAATPRVAEFGARFQGYLPLGLTLTFAVSGNQGGTTAKVERTPAEKAAALRVRNAADTKAHAAHEKAAAKLSRTHRAERRAVTRKHLSASATKARLKTVETRFERKRQALVDTCLSKRRSNKAVYLKAIAPYDKTTASTPYARTLSSSLQQLS